MSQPSPRKAYRPSVELLEDRRVPTTLAGLENSPSPQHLDFFDSATPANIFSRLTITNVAAGDIIESVAFRPATGGLYALGVNATSGRIYTLNEASGAATLLTPVTGFTLTGIGPVSGSSFSISFDPTADVIRLVGSNGTNLRINPASGNVSAVDTTLAGGGSTTQIAAIAYDRYVAGATATTLFGVDGAQLLLDRIGDVNGSPRSASTGTVTTIGPLGSVFGSPSGFGIVPSSSPGGVAFAVFTSFPFPFGNNVPATDPRLFQVNLATGAATLIGSIGNGSFPVSGLAVVPTVTSTATSTTTTSTNTTANQRFVEHVFQDLLGRSVEASSLAVLTSLLDAGLSRLQFVLAVEQSPEYLQRFVNQAFQLGGKSAPPPADLAFFVSFLQNGGSDLAFLTITGATPQAFVTQFFVNNLHRTPSDAEVAAHTLFIQSGGSLRLDQALIVSSDEYFNRNP
jgi:hypothetical protein